MRSDRRRLLQAASLGLLPSLHPLVAAAASKGRGPLAGLLLPLSGDDAGLGASMERAATLAQPSSGRLLLLDSEPAAATSARQALDRGAPLILGPVFARDVRAVVAAVGSRAPVLSFTNDGSLVDSGAFVFGVTPAQSVSAVLLYARERGVRRVAVVGGADAWARQSAEAAKRSSEKLGLELSEIDAAGVMAAAALPDAVLITDGGPTAVEIGRRLGLRGVQVLGTSRWSDLAAEARRALDGAWFAAPDPSAFSEFSRSYQASHGVAPGSVAGLTFDAVKIAQSLAAGGQASRAGLLDPAGFTGVMGAVRFHADGSCARELGILVLSGGEPRVVERTAGA